jgi:alkylation response protein AidB-like acyl-CoA dehydrogenase
MRQLAERAEELADLRDSATGVLSRAWSVAAARDLLDGPGPAYEAGLWTTAVELGWPDVMVSVDADGGGAGLRELCVLTEACGRAAAGLPLAASAAAAWVEQRPTRAVHIALPEPVRLESGKVSGTGTSIPYADIASRLLVLGTSPAAPPVLGAVDPRGNSVRRTPVVPLDHNPAAHLVLDGASIEVVAEGAEAAQKHAQAVLRQSLADVAELVGVATAANEAAAEYARTRVAFGKPIGSFQAIKHRLVNQLADIEVGRALVARAADAVDLARPDQVALASLATYWAIDRLRHVPEGALQVFGGIGYTWEHQAHVHLRRAARLAMSVGSRASHRARVSEWLLATQSGDRG